MTRNYYIYYALDPCALDEAEARVRTVLKIVECKTGIRGRLFRKADESALWMEVYEEVGDVSAFEHALVHALAKSDMEMYLASGSRRHVEIFTALAELPDSETADSGRS